MQVVIVCDYVDLHILCIDLHILCIDLHILYNYCIFYVLFINASLFAPVL